LNLIERTVAELAGHVADRVTRRLVRQLQGLEAGLLSDSGMKNLWDEICVQTRTDSAWSDSYVDFMMPKLEAIIASLHRHEQMALWLQTYAGQCFMDDCEDGRDCYATAPVSTEEIARHLMSEEVMYLAWNYENSRIRAATDL